MRARAITYVIMIGLACCFGATGCVDAIREGAVQGAGNVAGAAVENSFGLVLLPVQLIVQYLMTLATTV